MATTASSTRPDLMAMDVPSRAKWLLAQLRNMPGSPFFGNGCIWLALEDNRGLSRIIADLAPELTKDQMETIAAHLRRDGLWRASKKGRATDHYVRLVFDDAPDFTALPESEGAQWLLTQLRRLPCEVVTDGERRWLKLTGNDLSAAVTRIAPELREEQLWSFLAWLGQHNLRQVDLTGGERTGELFALEAAPTKAAPIRPTETPAADTADDIDAAVQAALVVMARAVQVITDLRGTIAALTEENDRLRREAEAARGSNQQLTHENTTLRGRSVLSPVFIDGLGQLREALNGGSRE